MGRKTKRPEDVKIGGSCYLTYGKFQTSENTSALRLSWAPRRHLWLVEPDYGQTLVTLLFLLHPYFPDHIPLITT